MICRLRSLVPAEMSGKHSTSMRKKERGTKLLTPANPCAAWISFFSTIFPVFIFESQSTITSYVQLTHCSFRDDLLSPFSSFFILPGKAHLGGGGCCLKVHLGIGHIYLVLHNCSVKFENIYFQIYNWSTKNQNNRKLSIWTELTPFGISILNSKILKLKYASNFWFFNSPVYPK